MLIRKTRSALYLIRRKLDEMGNAKVARKKLREVNDYLSRVCQSRPEVLVVANFLALGGIREHIHAIGRFSSRNVLLLPSDEFLAKSSRGEIETINSDQFFSIDAPSIKAVHTHVFPWAIEFGRQRQAMGNKWIHTYHLLYTQEDVIGEMPRWQIEFNEAQLKKACHADVCLSVSKWQVKRFEDNFDVSSTYLPNGVDADACERASADRFKNQYNIQEPFALYIGRDDPVKNPGEFARLATQVPELQCVMVGRSLDADYLESNYGVDSPSNLIFLPQMSHSEVLDAISACEVLVVTSKREGLPTLVMEAMAQSKPIVASREPGSSEVLGQGSYGFLYELGDIADLKKQLQNALGDTNKPALARQRVLEHYDWRVVAKQLDQIYLS